MKGIVFAGFFVLGVILAGYGSAGVDPGSVAGMWFFDEGGGDIAKDASDNGNDGEIMNGPKWVAGKFGKALEFDGADDWVNMGDDPILKPEGDVSFVVWYYWIGGNYVLSSGGQTSSTGYAITHDPAAGTIWFGVNASNKAANTGYFEGTSQDEWHHLAGAYDDSEGKLTAYIDGEVMETIKAGGGAFENKFAVLHIGKPNNVDNYYFAGIIDEVGVFNVALGQDDVKGIMNRGLEGALAVSASGKLAGMWGAVKK